MTDVRSALVAGDVERARVAAAGFREHAAEAHRLTSDPVWRVVGAIPFLGDNAQAVTQVAEVADGLGSRTIPRMLDAARSFDPSTVRGRGNRVDVEALASAEPTLSDVARELGAWRRSVRSLGGLHLLGPVDAAVGDLASSLGKAEGVAHDAATMARLVPPMLGADGPRRYFVAFQNNAEARGTGGLLGAYAVLEARHGTVRVSELGSTSELDQVSTLPIDLGKDFTRRYGNDPALWNNSNMSPHFPYGARIWLASWEQQRGERLDGVIATDPVALGYVLDATGPVTLHDGTKVTGATAADVTMRRVYDRYPLSSQNRVRDAYLEQIAAGSFTRLFSSDANPKALLKALDKAASDRRLLVYSAHRGEERALADTVVGGTLSSEPGSRVMVGVNNLAGNKMDFYLRRSLAYERQSCTDKRVRSKVEVTLTSDAPTTGLPQYVRARSDDDGVGAPKREGNNRVRLSVFMPVGARLLAANLDGRPVGVGYGAERGRPTVDVTTELAPGQSRKATFYLREPASRGRAQLSTTPLVQPATLRVTGC